MQQSKDQGRIQNDISKFSLTKMNTSILDDEDDVESSSFSSYVVPLKIILPIEHVHKSHAHKLLFERHNYILLEVDKLSYHEHIHSDDPEILFPLDKLTVSSNELTSTSVESTTIMQNIYDAYGNEYSFDSTRSEKNSVILVDSQGYQYELKGNYQIPNENSEAIVEFDEISVARPKVSDNTNKNIFKQLAIEAEHTMTTARTTIDHQESNMIVERYEIHYAKIFQWLDYHL